MCALNWEEIQFYNAAHGSKYCVVLGDFEEKNMQSFKKKVYIFKYVSSKTLLYFLKRKL